MWRILVVAALLAGCASPPAAPASCTPLAPTRGGGTGVCAVTSDGWILQGAAWNGASNATTILLVHGLNEDRHSYDALANELAAKGYRVLAFDSRGHGDSTHLASGATRALRDFAAADFAAMPRDLEAMRAVAAPDVLVGASVGANEAVIHAGAHDGGTRALALLSAGDSYQGLDALSAIAGAHGAALLLAAQGDAYAARSAPDLAARHPGPHDVHVVAGDAHGTNLLKDPALRAALVDWIAAHAASA